MTGSLGAPAADPTDPGAALPNGLSVVVPVFRSADALPRLIDRLIPVLDGLDMPTEIVLVEDGSGDGTWSVVEQLADGQRVRAVALSRNYGQHNAVLCGIRRARYALVATIDDDLQNPPEELPKLLAGLTEGVDVVYGTPNVEQHGFFRDMSSRITKIALESAMGAETARHVSSFRLMRTNIREGFVAYRGPQVSIDVLLTWGTTRFTHLVVRHDRRTIGQSTYTLRKLITHAFTMMTGFSTLPLQIASVIGFAFTLFGFIVLAYVLGSYVLNGGSVPGFAFLASIIAIFSGAQLFALGIIGEYLARIHFRTMDRPTYVIRNLVDASADSSAPSIQQPE